MWSRAALFALPPTATAGVTLCENVSSPPIKEIFDGVESKSQSYVPTNSLSTQLTGLKRRSTSIGECGWAVLVVLLRCTC